MRQRVSVALALVALSAFASLPVSASTRSAPHANGSASAAVRFGYFTTTEMFPVELKRVSDFPPAVTEFDAEREVGVVFVGAIDSPGRDFTVRGVLRRDGADRHSFTEIQKHNPNVRWYPVVRVFGRERLRSERRAKWTLDLYVDNQLAGRFPFEVIPRPEWQPILVKLELTGPPGARVKVDSEERTLDGKGRADIDLPPGRYTIETQQRGHEPYRHLVVLTRDNRTMRHEIVLKLRDPSIAIVEPSADAEPVADPQARVKLRVESGGRPTELRILQDGKVIETVTADPKLPAGEPWIVHSKPLPLAEGVNEFRIEVEDTNRRKGSTSVKLVRKTGTDVELGAEPGSRVVVNGQPFTVDSSGWMKFRLRPGTYTVEATKPGFYVATETLSVARGAASVRHRMTQREIPAPTIVAQGPPDQPVLADTAKLRIEIRSDNPLDEVRILRPGRAADRFTPDPGRRAGEPWVLEVDIKNLAEGENPVTLEAKDKLGRRTRHLVPIAREHSVAVDLRGEPGARVAIKRLTLEPRVPAGAGGPEELSLDAQGRGVVRVWPGDYHVQASKAGFYAVSERVTVPRGLRSVPHALNFVAIPLPAITLVDPQPGSEVERELVLLRIEVKSPVRLAALKVAGIADQLFRREPGAPAGGVWTVEAPLKLALGTNDIRLEAVEAAEDGGRSFVLPVKLVRVAPRGPDVEPPRIVIDAPTPDLKVEHEQIRISGLVTDNIGVARVEITVNGVPVPPTREAGANSTYRFTAAVVLQPGTNVIGVTAIDKAKNAVQEVRTVIRDVPIAVGPSGTRRPR